MQPNEKQLSFFKQRGDNQIMSLELLSIALGVGTWAGMLEGRDLVIWSDNSGAEAATRRGATKQFDHNCLVHALWKRFAELRAEVPHVSSVVCEAQIFRCNALPGMGEPGPDEGEPGRPPFEGVVPAATTETEGGSRRAHLGGMFSCFSLAGLREQG